MSEFLNNLKKAVEEGEFNSDAAKKINEIDKKADDINPDEAEQLIEKRLEESGVKILTEEEVLDKNGEAEMQMEKIKYQDELNKQIALLQDMEHMVLLSIGDMLQYVKTVEENFGFDKENESVNKNLINEIKRLKEKFGEF